MKIRDIVPKNGGTAGVLDFNLMQLVLILELQGMNIDTGNEMCYNTHMG